MSDISMLCNLCLFLERQCHLKGHNVEVHITKIIDILKTPKGKPDENLPAN